MGRLSEIAADLEALNLAEPERPRMNGICKILDGYFGAIPCSDCSTDGFEAVEVYKNGHTIYHGHFETEEDAEEQAAEIHAERLRENGIFGVGA
jgi:hypothetical protein